MASTTNFGTIRKVAAMLTSSTSFADWARLGKQREAVCVSLKVIHDLSLQESL